MVIDFLSSLIIIIPLSVLIWFVASVTKFVQTDKNDAEMRSKRKRRLKIASVVFVIVGIAFAVTIYLLTMALANFT